MVEKNHDRKVEPGPFYVLVPDQLSSGSSLSIARLLSRMRVRWRLIVWLVGVGALVGFGASFLQTPVYRSTVIVSPANEAGAGPSSRVARNLGSLASLAGVSLATNSATVDEAKAKLKSEGFLTSFVLQHDLMPILYASRFDTKSGEYRQSIWRTSPTLRDAYQKMLRKVIRVEQPLDTTVMAVHVEWMDPILASKWANALVNDLNRDLRNRAQLEATRSIEFLNSELAKTSVDDVRDSIFELLSQQLSNKMLASVREDFAFRIVDQARASEKSDYVRPVRGLFVVVGLIAGLVLAAMVALLRTADSVRE